MVIITIMIITDSIMISIIYYDNKNNGHKS
jgi:hypothetical protein